MTAPIGGNGGEAHRHGFVKKRKKKKNKRKKKKREMNDRSNWWQ